MHILSGIEKRIHEKAVNWWRKLTVKSMLYRILLERELPLNLYEPLQRLSQVTFFLDDYSQRRYRIFTDGFLDQWSSGADKHGDRRMFVKHGTWAICTIDGVNGWKISSIWITPDISDYFGLKAILDRFGSPEALEELRAIAEDIAPREAVHRFDTFILFTANYCLDRRDPDSGLNELKMAQSGA